MERSQAYTPGVMIPGTVYRVVRVIGAGGMGTVYDVEDTTVGKRYVLKALHAELSNRRDLAKRMEAEARTLARLSHPNIVEVVTAGATNDELRLPYYVMEKLNGQNLRTILSKKGSLDLPHAIHIEIDLLDALDNAHDKSVVHRDVKPDNIFLHRNHNGMTTTKLLDFGIMRLLDGDSGATAGRFMGTLRYAAPEQLRGEPPSPQTDLYAAALVLYEMVAGRGPFDDRVDPNKIAAAHIQAEPPPPSTWGVPVPEVLERLILGALSKNVSGRPKDAFTFAAQLRNLRRTLKEESPAESETSRPTDVPVAGLVTAATSSTNASSSSAPEPATYGATGAPSAPLERTHPRGVGASPTAAPSRTIVGMTAPPAASSTLMNASVGTRPPVDDATEASRGLLDRNASTHSLAFDAQGSGTAREFGPAAPVWAAAAETEPWHPQHTLRMDPEAHARAADAGHEERGADLLALLPDREAIAAPSDATASNTVAPSRSGTKPVVAIVLGLAATAAVIATALLAVQGVREHANASSDETAPEGTTSAPVTAPFAAPTLTPPLDLDPSEPPTSAAPTGSGSSAPPIAEPMAPASAAQDTPPSAPGVTAEPPQPLPSVHAAHRSAAPRPAKHHLPGSGL